MALEEVGRPQVANAVDRRYTSQHDHRGRTGGERPKVHDWKSCVRVTVPRSAFLPLR